MTDLCGGGPSGPQPGIAGTYVIDASSALSLLPAELAWLSPFLSSIPPIKINIAAFCQVDPISWTVPTAAELAALLAGYPEADAIAAATALAAAVDEYAWYRLCQCSAVTTPTRPVGPAAPPGLPQLNPTGIVSSKAPVCGSFDWDPTVTVYTGLDLGEIATSPNIPIPAGATEVVLTSVWGPGDGVAYAPNNGHLVTFSAYIGTTNGIYGTGGLFGQSTVPGLTSQDTFAIDPTAPTMHLTVDNNLETVPNTATIHGDFICSGLSTQSCCATDPLVLSLLQQILNAVRGLNQGSRPITGYVESTVHSGLTLDGMVSVSSDTVAVRVSITSDTSGLRISSGDPSFYWDRGYIVPITVEAAVRVQARLVYSPQLYVLPQLTVGIGYTLAAGVTVSITELLPG